jgi:glycosyltransferase involved in cell wall biosynthesis
MANVMSPPLVSVIIPVYNRPLLLREAAESVFAQTFSDFELILIDDGSGDDTPLTIEELRKRETDPKRLRVVRQKHTGMPGQVRNRGAAEARGNYIAFLDSDDLWKPEKLSRQVDVFRNNSAADGSGVPVRLCHTREIWLREGREISQAGQRHKRAGDIFPDALQKCIIGPSTVMMERSLFEETGGFREDLEIAEDYEYWLRITDAYPVEYIDEALVTKRAGRWEQLSEKYGHIEYFRLRGLKSLVDAGTFTGEHRRTAEAELAEKCRIYGAGCRKRGRTEDAELYEDLARAYRPD